MKYFLSILFQYLIAFSTVGQKKPIDSSAFDKWPTFQAPSITGDGKYVLYIIDKIPQDKFTLVIQATDSKWKKEIVGASDAHFTADSRWAVFKSNGDSLWAWQLGSERFNCYPLVQAYELVKSRNRELLALKMVNDNKEFRVRDLNGNIEKSFSHVIDFKFSSNGEKLLLQTEEQFNGQSKMIVRWIDIQTEKARNIWESKVNSEHQQMIEEFTFDDKGEQVVFRISEKKMQQSGKCLWYYKDGMAYAVETLNSESAGIPKGCIMLSNKFSQDGSRLFIDFLKPANPFGERQGVMVDIWSYADDKLQTQQLKEAIEPILLKFMVNLSGNQVSPLQVENERLFDNRYGSDDYMLLTTSPCYIHENYWRSSCRQPLYLINTKDGSRRLIKDGLIYSDLNGISPDRKYVVYYDYEEQAYMSCDLSSGKTVNISKAIPFPIFSKAQPLVGLPSPYSGLPDNWLSGNKGLILYDEYDIWVVDPAGIKTPTCLTNGYGRKNGVILRLAKADWVITEQEVLLVALRQSDKANGFYRLNLNERSSPELLSLDNYLYYWPYIDMIGSPEPLKAARTNTWVVQRMRTSEAPNFFVTKDFKHFQQLSKIEPQKDYNWVTAELHEWTMFDGKKSLGILYKPENFDSLKKYPVIFNFYEQRSSELNKYLIPEATGSQINIPYFVSNGYLVFVPDIHYQVGEPAESIYNAVISAAKYVARMSFVNSAKIGLQGHSFGGYEVNVLITKSNLFAAAAEAAGATNLVSKYNSVLINGVSNQFQHEIGQARIGTTLWEKPELFIKNSPIFYADKIRTPLLIMHCKNDNSVPFQQAIEWFTALRRLGKPTWMLQYDNGDHGLSGKEATDYTIRLKQFFDHYLKDSQPPNWMVRGVPAKLKGLVTGYEFNNNANATKAN